MNGAGGRFRGPMDRDALAFSSSLNVDRRLYREDIAGSIAHVTMLADTGILSAPDARRIVRGLRALRRDLDAGRLALSVESQGRRRLAADDVHMALEQLLHARIGGVAGRIHTARSRNDQVATDVRLYLRARSEAIVARIRTLQRSLHGLAGRHVTVLMPGYTHLRRGQPILLAHHLLAYVEMLERDAGRFVSLRSRLNRSPLGAGALAGTPFPIDRRRTARLLGFDGIVENSVDAVSDRDVHIEFLSACAITMMHLSRMMEDLILWSSEEWGFARIGEAFTTGSSIMPQKQNPDLAELIRGKSGRVIGGLVALLTVMKGLPLAYNRDMQEDKEPLFDAAETVDASLAVAARMYRTVTFSPLRFERELDAGMVLATDVADYLVRRGVPFRRAHELTGKAVRLCLQRKCSLQELPPDVYRRLSPRFGKDLFATLRARRSVEAKRSEGSTAPAHVRRALKRWKARLAR